MGFEQLAALRTQLAEKARQEKLAKQGGSGGQGRGSRPPKQTVSESDAVSDGTRPASEGKPKHSAHKPGDRPGNKPANKPGHRPAHKPTDPHAPASAHKPAGKPANASSDRPARSEPQHAQAQHKKRTERAVRPAREPATPTDPVLLLIRKLQNRFTATFPKKPAPKVPLKIGVFEDLMTHATELGADEAQLRAAIKTWCGGSRYWACMIEGAARIDLAGNSAGVVTAADANRARRLEAHREKRAQQRVTAATAPAAAGDAAAVDAAEGAVDQGAAAVATASADLALNAGKVESAATIESTITAELAEDVASSVTAEPAAMDGSAEAAAATPSDDASDAQSAAPAQASQTESLTDGH
jgi:ProP effector